jgi:phospholipase C
MIPRDTRMAVHLVLLLATGGALSCDPQKPSFADGATLGLSTPADGPLICGQVIPPDALATKRAACAFNSGALPPDTLGISQTLLSSLPIRHVIIMMKENRSFDHLLGQLRANGQPDAEAVPPTFSNPDLNGAAVFPFHATTTCIPNDPEHQSVSVAACIDDDKMDGFVRNAATTTGTDGHWAMSYYEPSDLPFDYFLAGTFAVNDRHFAPVASGTFANRDFLLFGSNAGVVDTGLVHAPPDAPSIMQLLYNAHFTWAAYTDGAPFSGALDLAQGDPGVYTMQDLYDALDKGTLPNVAFVDGKEAIEDDHADADLQTGEAWSKTIYDHVVTSPKWGRLVLFYTYDEGGAFADHVPPDPLACATEPGDPFTKRGPRVPMVAISPWAKRGYTSHVVQDHTAITRFIEALFGLPALTPRDANSDALLDMFDFSCSRDMSVPPAPAPGTGGCADFSHTGME